MTSWSSLNTRIVVLSMTINTIILTVRSFGHFYMSLDIW